MCNPSVETRTFSVDIQLKTNVAPNKVYSLTNGENIEYEVKDGIIIINHSFENFECIGITF
jgi:hypothetical protein